MHASKLNDRGGINLQEIKILNLVPVIQSDCLSCEDAEIRIALDKTLQKQTKGLVRLDSVFVDKGSTALECAYELAVSLPYIMEKAKWSERNGYSAVLLDCFMDPGLDECRELLDIPVIGACQSACSLAARLAGQFSVLMTTDSVERSISNLLVKYGMGDFYKPCDALDIPVLDLYTDRKKVVERAVEVGMKAIKRSKAKALVLGCTCMSDLVEPISAALAERGYPVLVIDPLRAAVYDAVACVLMGVSQSRLAYQLQVNKKKIYVDFNIL